MVLDLDERGVVVILGGCDSAEGTDETGGSPSVGPDFAEIAAAE